MHIMMSRMKKKKRYDTDKILLRMRSFKRIAWKGHLLRMAFFVDLSATDTSANSCEVPLKISKLSP